MSEDQQATSNAQSPTDNAPDVGRLDDSARASAVHVENALTISTNDVVLGSDQKSRKVSDADLITQVRDKIASDSGANSNRLLFVVAITGLYMLAEAVGGVVSGSLALLSDAGHMLSDFLALVLAYWAVGYSMKEASASQTYGRHRASVLTALLNAASLIALVLLVVWEALKRLWTGEVEVEGGVVIWVGLGGLLVNLIGLWVLGGHGHGHGHSHDDGHGHGASESNEKDGSNMNVRGAYLHVLGDLLGSVAAVISGILALLPGDLDRWADPLTSLFISAMIAASAYRLLTDAVEVLMERAPKHLDFEQLNWDLQSIPGVSSVHHVHVWQVTPELTAITAHVTLNTVDSPRGNTSDLMLQLRAVARTYNIHHCTFELGCNDPSSCVCVMQLPSPDKSRAASRAATPRDDSQPNHEGEST